VRALGLRLELKEVEAQVRALGFSSRRLGLRWGFSFSLYAVPSNRNVTVHKPAAHVQVLPLQQTIARLETRQNSMQSDLKQKTEELNRWKQRATELQDK